MLISQINTNKSVLKIIMILQIFIMLFTTSCTLTKKNQNDDLIFQQARRQLKELIIPKDMNVSDQKEEYSIPYTDKDLEEKNYNILPPI